MTTPIADPEELGKILRRARLCHEYPRAEPWEIEANVEQPIIAVWDRDISIATAVRDAVVPAGYVVVPVPDESKRVVHVLYAGGYEDITYADGTSEVNCIEDCGDGEDEEGGADE